MDLYEHYRAQGEFHAAGEHPAYHYRLAFPFTRKEGKVHAETIDAIDGIAYGDEYRKGFAAGLRKIGAL